MALSRNMKLLLGAAAVGGVIWYFQRRQKAAIIAAQQPTNAQILANAIPQAAAQIQQALQPAG